MKSKKKFMIGGKVDLRKSGKEKKANEISKK